MKHYDRHSLFHFVFLNLSNPEYVNFNFKPFIYCCMHIHVLKGSFFAVFTCRMLVHPHHHHIHFYLFQHQHLHHFHQASSFPLLRCIHIYCSCRLHDSYIIVLLYVAASIIYSSIHQFDQLSMYNYFQVRHRFLLFGRVCHFGALLAHGFLCNLMIQQTR